MDDGKIIKRGTHKWEAAHECQYPNRFDTELGTIWECNCGKRWKLTRAHFIDTPLWSRSYRFWNS